MQKIIIAVVVAVILLGGGYYFLMNDGVTVDDVKTPVDETEGTVDNPKTGQEQTGPSASESRVVIKNFAFSPNALRIKAGTKVTWTNDDVAGHSVTSDTNVFDSGVLSPGKSFERVFSQKGTFAYHCEPHPSMKGTVIVE